mgnify:FL=1
MALFCTGGGRLGRDPETRSTDYGDVVSASVAFDHGYGDRKTTTWVRVSVWGKAGETFAKLRTGNRVVLSGEIYESNWVDQGGEEQKALEMKATNVQVIDWPEQDEAPAPVAKPVAKPEAQKPAPKKADKADGFDDAMPF